MSLTLMYILIQCSTDSLPQVMEAGPTEFPNEASINNSRVLRDENNFIQNVGQFFNQQDMSDVILKVSNICFFMFSTDLKMWHALYINKQRTLFHAFMSVRY